MHRMLIKHINDIISNKILLFFFYFIFFLSLVLLFFTIYFQPLVGDDFHYRETVLNSKNFIEYFKYQYFNWAGRFPKILISYWIFNNNFNLIIYKILIIPFILITFYFFLKKILNIKIKFFSIDFVILFVCMWFIYPKIDETIFWTIGSAVYLIPFLISIFYLGLFIDEDTILKNNFFSYIFFFTISFLSGSSHLQVFVGGFIISTYYLFIYYQKKNIDKFKNLLPFYIIFLIGGTLSIFAPGNFERLDVLSGNTAILSTFYKSILFIFTSVFYLGDVQSALIYFLLIFFLFSLYSGKTTIESFFIRDHYIWLVAFLFSLFCMIPAINAVNTRVLFFPIIFLSIFFLNIIFFEYRDYYRIKIKNIFFYILVALFFLESFLGSLTNYKFKKEFDNRMTIINEAKINLKSNAIISHYTVIPMRLTHIPNPKHDKNDLDYLSKIHQIKIDYDDTFPRSLNIKKNIKFYFK